ncbi:MAG: DNA methylase, partial [Candidatus Sumerlaeia bacterium]|nr:DNA methylase [Candidatus Sumerlaeia bacterium]
RWTYQEARAHFDDARKLAQSTGIDLVAEWNRGFIKKDKEFIRVLGPQDRGVEELKNLVTDFGELIDVLHLVLVLWKMGKKDEIKEVLAERGFGTKDAFYRVAQAISETLAPESQEKRLLDGFLSGKEKLIETLKRKERFL